MSIFQFVVKGRDAEGNELRNIHHYDFANYVPDTAQLQSAVDDFDGKYKTNLQGLLHEDIEIYAYDVRRVDTGNLPSNEFVPTAGAWNGTGGTNRMPNQTSALVTFRAQSAFPRTTRTYLFPFTENSNNALGRVDASTISTLQTWANSILSVDVTGGTNGDKVAVEYGGDPRIVVDDNEIETVSTTNIWATQRRRKPGVGS